MNCKPPVQEKLRNLIVSVLGLENIYTLDEDNLQVNPMQFLPSPNELKYKYIIRCFRPRIIPFADREEEIEEMPEIEDDTSPELNKRLEVEGVGMYAERKTMSALKEKNKSPKVEISSQSPKQQQNNREPEEIKEVISTIERIQEPPPFIDEELFDEANQEIEKKITPKLRGITDYIQSLIGLIGGLKFNLTKKRYVWEMSSISRKQMERLQDYGIGSWISYHNRSLTRSTNSFSRIEQDNIDIVLMWTIGIQIATINYFVNDDYLLIHKAMFKRNGGKKCGYVLKPQYLISNDPEFRPSPFPKIPTLIKLEILSFNQIPFNVESEDEMDFKLLISFRGHKDDENKGNNADKETTLKKSNGYNIIWNENYDFNIDYPDFGFFIFQFVVQNESEEAAVLCQNCFHLSQLKNGLRKIPMLDMRFNELAFTFILAKIDLGESRV